MAVSETFGTNYAEKKYAVEKWVFDNIDYGQIKQGFPTCFFRNTSFYLTNLTGLQSCPESVKQHIQEEIIDKDMQDDLETARLINWCRNVSTVLPVKVPKDGNCLLHAIATAVWGILDDKLFLRRLLHVALNTDTGARFYSRWSRSRQGQISQADGRNLDSHTESMHQEWSEVCSCLDPERSASVAVPHRFLESIHVYTIANILRRPVIVMTDSAVRTFSGLSLQDNDMGGIYLPLEWDWADTCRTPVLLAYAQNHFCPLLFADHPHSSSLQTSTYRKNLAPLVSGKLEQLPVRLLLEGEEPEVTELLKKYLKVQETVMTWDGSLHSILCAEFEISSLPDDLNLVADYFRDCKQRFQHEAGTQVRPVLNFEYFQQTGNQITSAGSPQHTRTGQPPRGLSESQHFWPQHLQHSLPSGSRLTGAPLIIAPPNMVPQHASFEEHSTESSLNPPPSRKCIVPLCKFYGDQALGMMCSSCFKQYTITESRSRAAALEYERQQPTAPMPSIGAGEEEYCSSMMTERCKKGCGYRCSQNTYPFCHECAEKLNREAQEKVRAEQRYETNGAGAASASSAASTEPSSASAPGMAPPYLSAPQATAPPVSTSSSRREVLEPFTMPSILPVNSQAGTNSAQENDLMQFPSLVRTSVETSATGSGAAATLASPTQVLTNISITAPLSPPTPGDDTKDTELFGSGQLSPTITSGQPAATTASYTVATAGSQKVAGGITNSSPVGSSSENGKTSVTARKECITEGCSEEVVHQSRCRRCYIGMGLNSDPNTAQKVNPMHAGLNSLASASGHGFTNLKPSHAGKEVEGLTNPQQGAHVSCFPRPPSSKPPLNASLGYVQSWLQSTGPQTNQQAMGLPERQGGDELGQDLLVSGEACHMTGIKCVSKVCNNQVQQSGQLCDSCQAILKTVLGRQAQSGLHQESHPSGRQKCLEENCHFHGTAETAGYCSKHYQQLFSRQLAEETRLSHPANMSHTVPLAHNQRFVNMTPELRPITAPQGRVGKKCVIPACSYYGDPKQKNLCGKHYQEHISSIASASNVRVPMESAPYMQFSNQSATFAQPPTSNVVIMGTPETGRPTVFMQGAVSVPPPSFPVAESGTPGSLSPGQVAVEQSRSLSETYTRVATKNVKHCMTPGCTNFGNNSKGGLCNSCFENNEIVRQAILGDEECG